MEETLLEKIRILEAESQVHVEKMLEIRTKIEELRKGCKHSYKANTEGWFHDSCECEFCGDPVRR